jgi:Zn-dependent protease with chaperone function
MTTWLNLMTRPLARTPVSATRGRLIGYAKAMRTLPATVAVLVCALSISASADPTERSAGTLALRAQMLRLAEVDWKLRVAAGELCPRKVSGIGVWLDHSSAYPISEADNLFRTLRLGKLPQVAAVAASSPAALAGIRTGDEIATIGGLSMADELANSPDPALFAEQVMDLLSSFSSARPITLVLRRGKATLGKTVNPVSICAGRTILDTGQSLEAHTDDKDLAITTALVEFTANDDELAFILGHELAHVILRGETAEPVGDSLAAERHADVLGSSIAHCAGYDMRRAPEFWRRFDEQDSSRRSRLATHPSPTQREQRLAKALESFSCPLSLASAVRH